MTTKRTFLNRLRDLNPVGSTFASPEYIALEIRHRLRSCQTDPVRMIAFVAKEKVYAAPDNNPIADMLGGTDIIGTYVPDSRASRIAEDVRAWVKEAGR